MPDTQSLASASGIRAGVSGSREGDTSTYKAHSEALMVPLHREALERWEARDDGVLQETEFAEIRASRRSTVAYEADELGCREAAAALAVDDDERIRAVINEHCHDEDCGGRDFPDEPRPRRLSVVGGGREVPPGCVRVGTSSC